MPNIIFRFYEELNDVLPEHRRKIDFAVEFKGKRSIKDMIDELGVPQDEIDLILINGKSADFNTLLQNGDRISVYPVFESFNIKNVTLLRKNPLRNVKFIADTNLKNLAQYMKALGFDIYFNPFCSKKEIIEISKKEGRIILSKNKGLLKSKTITHGILVPAGTTIEQTKHVIDYLDIKDNIRPF